MRRLDLRSSNKHFALQNLSIYYILKNKTIQKKKHKIINKAWNGEFELPDSSYSVSDIQDAIECITKKQSIAN